MTTKKTTTGVAKVKTPLSPKPIENIGENMPVEMLVSRAIEKGVPVETMERLLVMMEKIKADKAKMAFVTAMAKLQKEMPVVKKTDPIKNKDGSVKYKFAPLDLIVPQVKGTIADNDFIYSFDTKDDGKMLTTTCKVTHIDGHTELNSFSVPIGQEQFMSEVQKYGARDTFAKRYAFNNAFGIVVEGEDPDATQEHVTETPQSRQNYTPRPQTQQTATTAQPTAEKVTGGQILEIKTILESKGKTIAWLENTIGRSVSTLNHDEAEKVLRDIRPKTRPVAQDDGIRDAEIEENF